MAHFIPRGVVGGLVLAATMAQAWARETISVPSNPIPKAVLARPAPGPLSGELYLPGKAGPYPVIIVLHTCAGIGTGALMEHWVDRVNEWGYAAFVLDSFAARGTTNVCAPEDQPKVTAVDRAGDVINAAVALTQVAGVDAHRIGVVGMSHGGATAVEVTRKVFEDYRPGLIKASVAYYGACRQPQLHGTVPLLALAGEADNWGNPAKTCTEFQQAMRPDQPMELHTYPGVFHSFDNPDNIRTVASFGHPMKYDYEAARDSFERTHAFFDRYVRDAK